MTIGNPTDNQNSQEPNSVPNWFRLLTVVFLAWNIMGLLAFFGQMSMSEATLAQLPLGQQEFYISTPIWAKAGFALAVFAGTIGSVLLMLKKVLAFQFFVGSFVGVVIQQFHALLLADALTVFGTSAIAMPLTVFIVALFLVWFSKHCIKKGWIA
jgi:hypothetical protein